MTSQLAAAPFLIEPRTSGQRFRRDYAFHHELREALFRRRGDAVLLAEVNVDDAELLEDIDSAAIDVNGYGYRCIRLRRRP